MPDALPAECRPTQQRQSMEGRLFNMTYLINLAAVANE